MAGDDWDMNNFETASSDQRTDSIQITALLEMVVSAVNATADQWKRNNISASVFAARIKGLRDSAARPNTSTGGATATSARF